MAAAPEPLLCCLSAPGALVDFSWLAAPAEDSIARVPGIERLSESVDADLLGLCLDTVHYYYGGGDPVDAVRKYGSRIRHLHLKDVRPDVLDEVRRDGVDFLEAVRRGVFCELGEGAIDFSYIISALTAEGFNGWAIVEQDIDPSRSSVRPVESAIRSRKFLRQRIGL